MEAQGATWWHRNGTEQLDHWTNLPVLRVYQMEIVSFLSTLYFLPLVVAAEHRFAHLNDQFVKPHDHGITHLNHRTDGVAHNSQPTKHYVRGGRPTSSHSEGVVVPDLLVLIEEAVKVEERWRVVLHVVCSTFSVVGALCLFMLSLWQTSRLFSQGLWSQKFFKGGGYWLIAGAGCGVVFGICLAFALDPYYICYFVSGFLLIGTSVIYIGRRGAILGTIGGLVVGLTLGIIHAGSISASIVEGVLCMFSGIAIGFVPIFPNLKINTRYIQQGIRSNTLDPQ